MRYCKDCQYSKKEYVQVGNQAGMVLVCENEECRNPVDGSAFPCDLLRREVVFCGLVGKHFKAKEEPKQEGTVISLPGGKFS